MKYANPVTVSYGRKEIEEPLIHLMSLSLSLSLSFKDISELLALCSSQSWSDRKDGMAQLKILLENPERELL